MKRLTIFLAKTAAMSLVGLMLVKGAAFAQETGWEKEGEIKAAEVIISKERDLTLPPAVRNFSKVQMQRVDADRSRLQYQMQPIKPIIPSSLPRLRFPTVTPEKSNELYPQNHIKLGFGNFLAPIGELDIHSNANDLVAAGMQVHHRSALEGPVDSRNSGNGETLGRIYGKVFGENEELTGSIGYRNRFLHYYGYPEGFEVNHDSIRQEFNTLMVDLGVRSVGYDVPFRYFLNGQALRHNDVRGAGEMNYQIDGGVRFKMLEGFDLDLKGGYQYSKMEGPVKQQRSLVYMNPSVHFEQSGVAVEAGIKAFSFADTAESRFRIFPSIHATFNPIDNIHIYGSADGYVRMNTFYSLTEENMFMSNLSPLQNTIRTIGFRGGAKFFLDPGMSFHIGADYGIYRDMFFFVNNTDPNMLFPQRFGFEALYDAGEVDILNPYAEFSFNQLQRVHFSIRGDYFRYDMGELATPWHRPQYQISSLLKVMPVESLSIGAGVLYLGGLQARDFESAEDDPLIMRETFLALEDIIDLHLNVEYRLSKPFSAFVMGNNLLGRNYERYWKYPVRGLQVSGGLIWRF
jgi:hypothetical protein